VEFSYFRAEKHPALFKERGRMWKMAITGWSNLWRVKLRTVVKRNII
jgi:hypothetical protein